MADGEGRKARHSENGNSVGYTGVFARGGEMRGGEDGG